MSCNTYDLCCRYNGQVVQIKEHSGRVHFGRITRVSDDRVWIDPQYSDSYHSSRNVMFHHYPTYHYGYPIALGFISGIILASLFFF